ncbi:MAG: acetyl-CoA C-acyltransferase [Planctomycetes bacterium]|nr:acetyl-CoA C-acyltransferase [Planctomycetota bacterium]NOG53719.1 acetyl-CoA C-acyltransferase [Planctomycetota bacterium]
MTRRAAIIEAVRTPIGKYAGTLSAVRPDDLAALVIKMLVDRAGIDPAVIDDVYFGATNQAGEDNRNVARMAALLADLPDSVPGATVNRLCASGLDAINIGARLIESGQADVIIAGGTESMSRAPVVMSKATSAYARNQEIFDSTIGWRFVNPKMAKRYPPIGMVQTAENLARRYNISREDQDAFALGSQHKWGASQKAERFADEIVPVEIPQRKGDPVVVDTDEHPRPDVTIEQLAKLRPVFASDDQATVTAGNSSGINDGAAGVLLIEESLASKLGLTPMAFAGPAATAGVDPNCMGIGPVPATQKLLARTGRTIADFDIIELNEAFACQALACIRELGIDRTEAVVNPNGGAIAIGHPLGCTGARLVVTLTHELARSSDTKLGLASLCVGIGQGMSMIIEKP